MYQRLKILVSPLFLFFLFVLIINDFFLKAAFHNTITGKLSDFSGLFIFPIFCSAIFPKQKSWIFIFTAVLFAFWKSEYSSFVIQLVKPYFNTGRTVDLSDLIALPMILFAWFYLKSSLQLSVGSALTARFSTYFIAVVAIFSFCATSQPRYIQSFDQPQYVLLKDPSIRCLDSYDGLEFYSRDSLLVVKIDYLYINRPVKNDDYNKNQSVRNLDLAILHLIADSASLVPSGKITFLTVSTKQGIDSLRFNGGRLDGRFVRMKGGKAITEGFYKMGLEDSTWTIRDSTSTDKVVKTFVHGEATHLKRYKHDKLESSSNINTRSDTIFNIYIQLIVLIICLAGICFLLYRNYRKAVPVRFNLSLFWKVLLCFVAPFIVWLFYIGVMLLLMNYNQDTFEAFATGILIFIVVCPLMFVVIFGIKLRKDIDIFLYCLLLALAFSIWTTCVTLGALSN